MQDTILKTGDKVKMFGAVYETIRGDDVGVITQIVPGDVVDIYFVSFENSSLGFYVFF